MAGRRKHNGDGPALALRGPLTLDVADDVRERLRALLAQPGAPTLDLSGVTRIDVAGRQLICAAQRSASAAGRRLLVSGMPRTALPVALSRAAACVQRHPACVGADVHACPWQGA